MKSIYLTLALLSALLLLLFWASPAKAQTIFPNRGGTGLTTAPAYGQVLLGTGSGTYQLVATSSLGISGGSGGGAVDSVFGRTGDVTAQSGDYTTAQVTESGNLYYTNGHVQTFLDSIAKGYFFGTTSADYWFADQNTDDLAQGDTNKYFSTDLARAAFSAGTGIGLSSGVISNSGVLSFNGNAGAITLSSGDVTTALGYAPSKFSYPFPLAATSTKLTLSGGVSTTYASTTAVSGTSFCLSTTCITSWPSAGSGTVTSVALTVPTGLSVSGSPITTSGTFALSLTSGYVIPKSASTTDWNTAYLNRITSASSPLSLSSNVLSIQAASGSQNGYLSSTDWTTFNGKQGAITLTTTGTSGAATFSGGTLNIPQYAGNTYIASYPITLTSTTFGLAFGTTTNNTWSGTNTFASNKLTVSGLSDGCVEISSGLLTSTGDNCGTGSGGITSLNGLTGSSQTFATSTSGGLDLHISSSGSAHTFTIAPASGYLVPLSASTTNWNTFYNTPSNRITAGTGLSWSGNTLNASAASIAWGAITGTLSSQTDLQTALNGKIAVGTTSIGSITALPSLSLPYSQLTSKPTIPTKTSDLTNDSGFITSYTETDPIFVASAAHSITSTDITHLSNLSGTNTGDQDLSGYALTSSLAAVATSGAYSDLTGTPTIPAFFAYPFLSNATSTKLTFSGGLATTYASTTAVSGTSLCIGSDCRTTWPSSGGTPTWGTIAGTLSDQTDLQSALNAKLSLSSWYATTTDGLAQGSVNKYWSNTLFDNRLSATTSLPALATASNLGTVKTSLSGVLKASSGVLSAATNGTDYTLITAKTCTSGDFVSSLTAAGVFTCTTPSASGVAWGSITGTLSSQTDLQTALDAKLSLSSWFATTSAPQLTTLANLGTVKTSLSGILKASSGVLSAASSGTDYEVPLTFSTGLTRSTNTITVNTTQNIAKLSNLTSNGLVKTSGSDGTLSIDTNTYLTGNQSITLSGDISGSGATSITTAIGASKVLNSMLAGSITTSKLSDFGSLASGSLLWWNGTNIVATGTPSFTSGYFVGTSTATSTFGGGIQVGGSHGVRVVPGSSTTTLEFF